MDKSVVVKGEKPKPPPKVPTSTIKTNEKPLSEADILKALGGGARPGATNSLPKNEGERCFGVIKRTIDREWSRESFTWYAGLRSGIVEIQLGKDGTLRGWRLAGTTGSAEVDNSIRRAMTRIERFHGLTATFISTYPVISIELKPVGR
ncbi:MAG: hypothetical protein IJ802_00365 [Kiritimatiellae bacterium]|nr:hypothetical protein [Kiritimatiellia bacterium]